MLAVKKKAVVKKEVVVKKAVVKRAVTKKATTKKASTKEVATVAEEVKAAPPKKVVKVTLNTLSCGAATMPNCCSGTYLSHALSLALNFYCKVDYDDGSSTEVGRQGHNLYSPGPVTREQIEQLPQEVFDRMGVTFDTTCQPLVTATTVLKYAHGSVYKNTAQDVASAILARCGFEQVKVAFGSYGNTVCLWVRVRKGRQTTIPLQ